MFMASKYEEIYALNMKTVHEKIAHFKLSPSQIRDKEMEIMVALNYRITNVTSYEFVASTLFHLGLHNTMPTRLHEYLLKASAYLSKVTMYDYELISQQDYSELAAATLLVAFKIVEQLDKSFPLSTMIRKIQAILEVREDVMLDCATRILSLAKNFDRLYPNLQNLKKFHTFNYNKDSDGQKK